MTNEAPGWRRLPWTRFIICLGIVGSLLATAIAVVISMIAFDGAPMVAVLIIPGFVVLPVGVLFTIAARIGGWAGRRHSAKGELIGITAATLAVTGGLSGWMATWPGGAFIAICTAIGGLLAAAGFSAATYFYRAIPFDPEVEARRVLARKLDERAQHDA